MQFIIISPPKNPKSAGSMVLYELADEIKSLGHKAARVLLTQNREGHFFVSVDEKNYTSLKTDTLEKIFDPKNSIIIHGENLHHKYFDKFTVARYYLNKIGALKNIGVPRPDEYKIAWQSSFVEKPDALLRRPVIKKPTHENLQFDQARWIDLTYIGKGNLYDTNCRRLPGTIELTRAWPNDTDEYLLLLSKTRFLFTFDSQTAVIEEAIVYGAQPVLMSCMPYDNFDSLFDTLRQDVIDCCLDLEGFKQLDGAKIDQHFKNFRQSRNELVKILNTQKERHLQSLRAITDQLRQKFMHAT